MPNEFEENDTLENESDEVAPESTDESQDKPDDSKLKSALAQKDHFRQKFEESEAKRQELENELNKKVEPKKSSDGASLGVEDYIDISSALDGLDHRQKAHLAEQHKLSGKPLKEIRESEDFQFWNEAYTLRKEKEAALKPNATQEREDVEPPFQQKLKTATVAEKEEMLKAAGLYRDKRATGERKEIGQKRALY